jgi:hypothetical protein
VLALYRLSGSAMALRIVADCLASALSRAASTSCGDIGRPQSVTADNVVTNRSLATTVAVSSGKPISAQSMHLSVPNTGPNFQPMLRRNFDTKVRKTSQWR